MFPGPLGFHMALSEHLGMLANAHYVSNHLYRFQGMRPRSRWVHAGYSLPGCFFAKHLHRTPVFGEIFKGSLFLPFPNMIQIFLSEK